MYDLVIIGGGPGGYTCAIRAAQLGGSVCLIEKNGLGGTCTQRGCIPTKYLHSVGDVARRANQARKYGLNVQIGFDYDTLKSKMQATVAKLESGIRLLLKSNGVKLIEGEGHLVSESKVAVNNTMIETRNIVIATGGRPVCLPNLKFGSDILSTTSILELNDLPYSISIIGGGYSGCEFASILNALGCKVTLIEAEDHLLPNQIKEIGNAVEKYLTLDGVDVRTNSLVQRVIDKSVVINGEEIQSQKILLSIGRQPNIDVTEFNKLGINYDRQGIAVDTRMRTNIFNIYAVGDVTGKYELAHAASAQGEIAAENILGSEKKEIDYRSMPACVFTYPEVAFVGDLSGRSGEFPFIASAKANCLGDTRGLVKVFERGGKLVGTYIIGPHAGEIIGEAVLAIKTGLSYKEISKTVHAHPTLPEAFAEAVRDIDKETVHIPPKSKNSKIV